MGLTKKIIFGGAIAAGSFYGLSIHNFTIKDTYRETISGMPEIPHISSVNPFEGSNDIIREDPEVGRFIRAYENEMESYKREINAKAEVYDNNEFRLDQLAIGSLVVSGCGVLLGVGQGIGKGYKTFREWRKRKQERLSEIR